MKKVPVSLENKTILVTGSPGFIGAGLVRVEPGGFTIVTRGL